MKKIIFISIIVVQFYSCNKNSEKINTENFVIIGNIENIPDNIKVYLKTQEYGKLTILDSTIVRGEKFEFTGKIDKPVIYGVFINNTKDAIGIFMENSTITIEAYKDSLASSKVSGSKTNDEYLNFVKKSNQIISKMNILFPEFQKARAENDVEKLKEINEKMQQISNANTNFTLDYAKRNPDSYIGAMALHSILNIPTVEKDTIEKIYKNFSDFVKKGDFALKTKTFLDTNKIIDSIQN